MLIILSGCGTVREGFKNQKKNSSDEFLVEKKSPLILPPKYNELPIPNENKNENKNKNQENDIKKLITGNNDDISQEISKSDLEKSILSKIENK